MELVLKTSDGVKPTVSSNLTLSANKSLAPFGPGILRFRLCRCVVNKQRYDREVKCMENQSPGLRLLKKGQKGILKMIFSRMSIILMALLLNIGLLFAVFAWFEDFLPQFYGGTALFILGMVTYLINSRMDPTAKITWLILIMLLPVFGSLLYLFTRRDIGHRAVRRKLQKIYEISGKAPVQTKAAVALEQQDPAAAAMARYVSGFTGIPVCGDTDVSYFPLGEDMLARMLQELDKAESSIYLEYFIIDEGLMWGQILERLAQKAAAGVDVRVIYDGTCEFLLLPKGYPQKLKALGIACHVFAPVTPFLSTHYNYRDHRKILTIDGKLAFTGGVNLADEYINAKHPFGHWKDTAVMLRGEGARYFERMFLQMWNLEEREPRFPSEMPETERNLYAGFVMPYYEDPLDNEHVGRQVFVDILNRAQRYVHIMTPYLILDGELEAALTYAAKRGVDVTLLLPGIPDKKIPYALAKSHYPVLVEAGVKVFEYTPGFVHAKLMIADSREAVVGTINFDYRSLYHHFECAVYLNGVPAIEEIAMDFDRCIAVSAAVTPEAIRKEKLFYKLAGALLKPFATLL